MKTLQKKAMRSIVQQDQQMQEYKQYKQLRPEHKIQCLFTTEEQTTIESEFKKFLDATNNQQAPQTEELN